MRVLITGISGFVGRALAASLTDRGQTVGGTYVERHTPGLDLDLYRADLLDTSALGEAVRRFAPDRIVHLAGLSHVGKSFGLEEAYSRVNVRGTENLLAAAGDIPVILASSSEVYGLVPEAEQPISEDRAPSPESPYAESKLAAERLVAAAGGVIVRCFNIIGPGQSESFALPSFARQLADIAQGAQEPVLRVGNLDVWRDFTHVDDAAEGYAVILDRAASGGVFNLGSGRAHRLKDLLDRLIAISGVTVDVEVDPERFRPADAAKRFADVRRIHALGWQPRRGVAEALESIWSAASLAPAS